jgi:hypothetical protein
MEKELKAGGFDPGRRLTVSHFRLPVLKQIVPTGLLSRLDSIAQLSGDLFQLSPSVFVYCAGPEEGIIADPDAFFACPDCLTPLGDPEEDKVICPNGECRHQWSFVDNIYDFKNRVE